MGVTAWLLFFLVLTWVLSFNRASLKVWSVAYLGYLLLFAVFSPFSLVALVILLLLWCVIFLPLLIRPLRCYLLSRYIFTIYRRIMPKLSATEKEALEAGDVGFERDIFSGMPDWFKLQQTPPVNLSDEEQAFLDGPTETLCRLIDEWEMSHQTYEIPESIWQYFKKQRFFALIIPKQYGGKAFSALAHSQILAKVASVSTSVATALGVPNSLGPAELLLKYGTQEQKDYYLPRLACGEDIPCFALTSAQAGSDAGAIEDHGIVVRDTVDGVEQIGILLNWDKRYITLAPVATLLGLAFKLYDPDHLLGSQEALGITCALVPVNTPGVVIGRRHYPLCATFPNGPTQGKNVFIPLHYIIGGKAMIGAGWRMLMECLAVGRAISLPSTVIGSAKRVAYMTGAYARVRRQFNLYIGAFGGVQQTLTRLVADVYRIDALRLFSVGNLDRAVASSVASAITKYHSTQTVRDVISAAMDIHGGKAICMGPSNYLAQSYIETPIGITVEGANILTRSMIIFGQGAVRCHPFIMKELVAAQHNDIAAIKAFDEAFFKHAGMLLSNKVRAFTLAFSSAYGASAPKGELKRYYQHFSRFSAAFSWLSDIAMMSLGAELKRNEALSARLGDMLSGLYMGSCVLYCYEQQGNKNALPVVQWVCQDILFRLQNAAHEFLMNFPFRFLARVMRCVVFPLGRHFNPPSDKLGKKVAALFLEPSETRDQLAQGIYFGKTASKNPMHLLQQALAASIKVERLLKRLFKAEKAGIISGMTFDLKVSSAVKNCILTSEEADQLIQANALCLMATAVDDFPPDYFYGKTSR